jgi:Kdo2-lipid IVA lauroyltransferase/acyltransferase
LDEDPAVMLRVGLEIADRLARLLPRRVAYFIADRLGDAWRRGSPQRRQLVAANLRRVCLATGRPTGGEEFETLVRDAFRNHARYYLEVLRTPHYRLDRIERHVSVPRWPAFRDALAGRPGILVSSHLGNFEPFGTFLGMHGLRPLAPIEEIRPPALYRFLAARRGGRRVDLVPLRHARRALAGRLSKGGLVGIIGDRDLDRDGLPVMLFGHATTVPTGAAALAVLYRATVIVGRCLRTGPDRFLADGELLEVPDSGNRRADVQALTRDIAARFEQDIGAAPEQWWGAFQPFWPDLDPERRGAR